MDVVIRPMGEAEADHAAHIHGRAMEGVDWANQPRETDGALRRLYGNYFAEGVIWGLFHDERPLGQMVLTPGWLRQLHVMPEWQRRGVGKLLVQVAQREQADLQLWAVERNVPARILFEHAGFVQCELTEGEVAGGAGMRYRWIRRPD